MGRLKSLEPAQRPRERLLREGAESLEDDALLAIVFGTGRGQNEDALELASRVIDAVGGLGGLAGTSAKRMMRVVGVGPVKVTRLLAATELARRISSAPPPETSMDDATLATRMRGQVPTGEVAILAVVEDDPGGPPVTIELGCQFGPDVPPGRVLSALLTYDSEAAWSVVVVRAGRTVTPAEQLAGEKLLEASGLVGLAVERVLIVSRADHWRIIREQAA